MLTKLPPACVLLKTFAWPNNGPKCGALAVINEADPDDDENEWCVGGGGCWCCAAGDDAAAADVVIVVESVGETVVVASNGSRLPRIEQRTNRF